MVDSLKRWTYHYPMPAVTATVIVSYYDSSDSLFLVAKRRSDSDAFPNKWCFPGGFLNVGKETIEQTAVRELFEETGLKISEESLQLLCVSSDPRDDPRYHVVNICYRYLLNHMEEFIPKDDVTELKWVKQDEITSGKFELAFNHNKLAGYERCMED